MQITPEQLFNVISQLGPERAAAMGFFHELVEGNSGEDDDKDRIKIKEMSGKAHTVSLEDDGYLLVFNSKDDVTLTLANLAATNDKTIQIFATNEAGRIALDDSESPMSAYANNVDEGITCGLIKGSGKWHATGTNVKDEDA